MKILYVTTISDTINGFLIPHIKFLINNGNQVDIACNIVENIDFGLIQLGCKIYDIPFQRSPLKNDNYRAYKKIKETILEEGYELVHTHTPVASFLTRLACRSDPTIKIIYTAHGFHFFNGASLDKWIMYYTLEKIVSRWTCGLITINEEDYSIAKKMKLKKSNSVYKVNGVGVNLQDFFPYSIKKKKELKVQYGYSSNDFIVLYVAELNYNKHQDLIIKAVKLLTARIPNLKLLIAGDGIFVKKYKDLVGSLDLEGDIEFLGYRKDIANLLNISDIAVSASRREGLPVSIMEAMATGLPIVVTNCRGNRDLVVNGENGYVVDINDGEGFADAIEKLYKFKELRRKFGKNNLKLVSKYSIENVIKEMEQVYSDYLNER